MEGWKKGETERMRLGECVGVGGLQKEQTNERKGNEVRWGPDEERLLVTGLGFILTAAENTLTRSKTFNRREMLIFIS